MNKAEKAREQRTEDGGQQKWNAEQRMAAKRHKRRKNGHGYEDTAKTRNAGHFLVFASLWRHLSRRDAAKHIGVVPTGDSPAAASELARIYFPQ